MNNLVDATIILTTQIVLICLFTLLVIIIDRKIQFLKEQGTE